MARDVNITVVRIMQVSPGSMPRIADLWKLQEIDSALDTRGATLDDARMRIGESDEIAALRARVAELQAAARDARAVQRDLELQADELRAKITPAEQKLYGGAVRNPKELQDLQADVDQMKRHLSSLEDQDLAALTAFEQADADAKSAQAELTALESAWQQEQHGLRATVARLEAEVATLEADRRDQAAAIEPEMLKLYDHVRRAHQGRGVAKIDRNICLGCRIALPPAIVNRARSAVGFAQCPNCERILFT